MKSKYGAIIPVIVLALCISCLQGKVYHHYNHIPLAGLDRTDTLTFDVPAVERGGIYATDLELRTTSEYPFTSIAFVVEQTAIPSQKQRTDTVTCKLMDSKGNVKGKGVSHYQYRMHVSEMLLSDSDSLHVTVNHYMRRDVLPGVSDVGVAVSRLR